VVGTYADNYLLPTMIDRKIHPRKSLDDAIILQTIKKLDLGSPYFSVVQPNGSHFPCATKSPSEFKRFGTDSELSEYENSVLYTDELIKRFIRYVSNYSSQPWVFIMTSDHGLYVDKSRASRSTKYPSSYMVPGIILTNQKQLYRSYIQPLEKCSYLFHQDISEMIARILGFDVPMRNCNSGVLLTGLLSGIGSKNIQISTNGDIQVTPYITKKIQKQ